MKRIRKIALALLALTVTACVFTSCSIGSSSSLEFRENEGGYGLYRYKNTSTQDVFDVPETYLDKPVTELMAFSIANAEYLKVLNIGKNIEKIDVWALTNCPMLTAFNVAEENPYFKAVDGVLYNKDMTELVAYPNGKTKLETNAEGAATNGGNLVVPDSVKTIRENAFYLCANLYTIKLNQGLETIGNKAFLKCGNLSALKLPDTVTTIGVDAFSYCNALKALEIPSSVQKIDDYAFFSTSSSIEKVIVHQPSADALTLGTDWLPNKKNSVSEKVPVEYVGNQNS